MRKPKRRFTVSVESLEGRLLMSAAPQYTVKDLGPMPQISAGGGGINSSGQVVGTTWNSTGSEVAFLSNLNDNTLHLMNPPTSPSYYINDEGFAVNDSGQVVGDLLINSGNTHAFISGANGGPIQDIGSINGYNASALAFAINNSGQVVGSSSSSTYSTHAFFYSNGVMRDLGSLGGSPVVSVARGINSSGQVAGYSTTGNSSIHAFLSDPNGGTLHDLGSLGGANSMSEAFAVNTYGQVAGVNGFGDGSYHAFLSDPNGGQLHDIGIIPGGRYDEALSVNDHGYVVGHTTMLDGPDHGFFYDGNTIQDLNDLVPTNTTSKFIIYNAVGINNSSQIAAIGFDRSNGQLHAMLLTPVPPAPVAPTITWSNPADIVYGTPLSSTQLNATADVPGTFTYNVAEGTVLHAGAAQSLEATFTPTDTSLYTTATADVFLNVTPAPLTVTANNATKIQSLVNPPLSGTITGLVNGDTDVATYSTTATTSSPVGTYPITPALTDSNYNVTLVPGTLTIVPPPSITRANGIVTAYGNQTSGNVVDVSINPANQRIKVTVNGYSVEFDQFYTTRVNYIGNSGGNDTYTNSTSIASTVTVYGGNNTMTADGGSHYWYLYGSGNSILDNNGQNYVFRNGYAVSETGTGIYHNLS